MKNYIAEPVSNDKYKLAESPFYDESRNRLSYVDIIAGKFYLLDEAMKRTEFDVGQQIGAAVPVGTCGEFLFCATDAIYRFDGECMKPEIDITEVFEDFQRCNDAKLDPMGRLFVGSSVYKEGHEDCGNLYCCENGNMRIIQPNTKISNGMAWSRDRKHFYFSDSLEHAVFVYDYDENTGDITDRRVLFYVEDGVPDGLCIDAEDNIWLAVWGGRRIECHESSEGKMIARVDVPAQNVTSCCFYGDKKNKLFITTSGNDLTGEYDGCLFTCDVEARGV